MSPAATGSTDGPAGSPGGAETPLRGDHAGPAVTRAPGDRAPEISPPGFSTAELRRALGAFATGVTVITTQGRHASCGMTANAFSSLSLDPPLVLVCVGRSAELARAVEANGAFAVNILSAAQEPLSRYFASRDRPRGPGAFSEVAWRRAGSGSPILDGVAGHIDCRLQTVQPAGDHVIVIGTVTDLGVCAERSPLLFVHGRYATVASWSEAAA